MAQVDKRLFTSVWAPQRCGSYMPVTTTAAIAAASVAATGSAASAINSISHCVYGDDREIGHRLSTGETLVGAAANTAAMVFWSALYELMPGRKSVPRSIAPAIIGTALAYVVDYHVVPKRYSPGFERFLPGASIAAIYAVFSRQLLRISTLWNQSPRPFP